MIVLSHQLRIGIKPGIF